MLMRLHKYAIGLHQFSREAFAHTVLLYCYSTAAEERLQQCQAAHAVFVVSAALTSSAGQSHTCQATSACTATPPCLSDTEQQGAPSWQQCRRAQRSAGCGGAHGSCRGTVAAGAGAACGRGALVTAPAIKHFAGAWLVAGAVHERLDEALLASYLSCVHQARWTRCTTVPGAGGFG